MTISDKLYAILIQGGSWKTILGGLWVTVQIFVLALVLGTVLGAVICLMRTRKNPSRDLAWKLLCWTHRCRRWNWMNRSSLRPCTAMRRSNSGNCSAASRN